MSDQIGHQRILGRGGRDDHAVHQSILQDAPVENALIFAGLPHPQQHGVIALGGRAGDAFAAGQGNNTGR